MKLALPGAVLLLAAVALRGDELKPAATVKLNSTITDLHLSADRAWLYFLNTSEGKIQRIDTARRTLDSVEGECTENTERMAASLDGKTIFTCASPNGHQHNPKGKETGKIQIFDAATLKAKSTFSIPLDPFDIKVGPSDFIYISGGSSQHTQIAIVDPRKKSIIGQAGGSWQQSFIELTPDGKRIYHSSTGISPSSINGLWMDSPEATAASKSSVRGGNDANYSGTFQITADGRFLVSHRGPVLRLAKGAKDDLQFAGKIEPHLASAVARNGKLFLAALDDSTLKVYSYPDFELKTSWELKNPAFRMVLDGTTNTLYCAAGSKKKATSRRGRNEVSAVGNIEIYDVTNVMKGE